MLITIYSLKKEKEILYKLGEKRTHKIKIKIKNSTHIYLSPFLFRKKQTTRWDWIFDFILSVRFQYSSVQNLQVNINRPAGKTSPRPGRSAQ